MGSATAREFVDEGWNDLLLCDIKQEPLENVAAQLREAGATVRCLVGNISDPDFPGKLLLALGDNRISALVHTAGLAPQMADSETILSVNLDASVRLVDAVRDRMQPGSAAVLFSSTSAEMPVDANAAKAFEQPLPPEGALALRHLVQSPFEAYQLSKIAIRALVRREANAFGERAVRLVSLSPGAIDTAMTQGDTSSNPAFQQMIAGSALGRMGKPEEVAAIAVFLCSPKASFVTAVDWIVDGGQVVALGT